MPNSDDIVNLFHQFGGQADDYQEISRAGTSRQSRARWPLLSALDVSAPADVPAVQAGESAGVPPPVIFRPAPLQPVAEHPPAVEPAGVTPPGGTPATAPPHVVAPAIPTPIAAPAAVAVEAPADQRIRPAPPLVKAALPVSTAPGALPAAPALPAAGSPLAQGGRAALEAEIPPASATPGTTPAPSGDLHDIFSRLSGRTPPSPGPAPLAALWRDLGGNA